MFVVLIIFQPLVEFFYRLLKENVNKSKEDINEKKVRDEVAFHTCDMKLDLILKLKQWFVNCNII